MTDNAQRMYKAFEVADAIAAEKGLNQWAKQGWVLDSMEFCQKMSVSSGSGNSQNNATTTYTNWYLVIMSKGI